MIEILPVTAKLLEDFGEPMPAKTIRGVAAVRAGEVLGVAGVYTETSRFVMFLKLAPELLKRGLSFCERRALIRGYKTLLVMLNGTTLPIQALADPAIRGSDRLLEHAGFGHVSGGVYEWLG